MCKFKNIMAIDNIFINQLGIHLHVNKDSKYIFLNHKKWTGGNEKITSCTQLLLSFQLSIEGGSKDKNN